MDFPIEVWRIIFSFLPLNEIIEVSAVCKEFYCETRKNKFFMEKMSETRRLYRNERTLYEYYHYSIMCLSFQLSTNLKDYVSGENLLRAREILSRNVYYQILPFRFWNHLFMCEWSQFCVDMCRSCMNGCRNYVKLYKDYPIISPTIFMSKQIIFRQKYRMELLLQKTLIYLYIQIL